MATKKKKATTKKNTVAKSARKQMVTAKKKKTGIKAASNKKTKISLKSKVKDRTKFKTQGEMKRSSSVKIKNLLGKKPQAREEKHDHQDPHAPKEFAKDNMQKYPGTSPMLNRKSYNRKIAERQERAFQRSRSR